MCVFCMIVEGKIPSKKIYEDEDVIAILDISQATYGHTLVIPKKHYANIVEMPNDLYLHVMEVCKKLANELMIKLDAKGINILNNCNEAAGQTVMHFHVHLLPRYENDNLAINFIDNSKSINLDELQNKLTK